MVAAIFRRDKARARVERSPHLSKYKSIIMTDYGGRHWEWVTYAKVKEIVAWAKQIQEDSDESTEA